MGRRGGYRWFGAAVVVLVAGVLVCRGWGSAREHRPDELVVVEGMITVASAYGPPGFGETPEVDALETVWVLMPDAPFWVRTVDGGRVDAGEIQVIGKPGLRAGEHRLLIGRLFEAHTGHHHRAWLLDVSDRAVARARR